MSSADYKKRFPGAPICSPKLEPRICQIEKELLESLYLGNCYTIKEIGKIFGYSKVYIKSKLYEFGIGEDNRIKCEICGKKFELLPQHIIFTEKISIEEYKERYPNTPIIMPEVAKKRSKNQLDYWSSLDGMIQRENDRERNEKIWTPEKRKEESDKWTPEMREQAKKQTFLTDEQKRKQIDNYEKVMKDPKTKEKYEKVMKDPKTKEKYEKNYKKGMDTKYQKNWKKAMERLKKEEWKNAPNNPESYLLAIIQKYKLPFQYTGAQSFFVGDKKYKNPDFVTTNENKVVIEHFGIFWHNEKHTGLPKEEHEQNVTEHYKKHGYDCIIFWEDELYEMSEIEIIERLTKYFKENYLEGTPAS